MIKCALVIGHSEGMPGAFNKKTGMSEFQYNELLAMEIYAATDHSKVELLVVYRNKRKDLPKEINKLKPDFIISMHCNAFNQKASGTEVLYYHKSEASRKIASILNVNLLRALGLKSRGVIPKKKEDRGGHLLKKTKAPCVISEPFFIDNDSDYEVATSKRTELINAYAKSIVEISKEVKTWKR